MAKKRKNTATATLLFIAVAVIIFIAVMIFANFVSSCGSSESLYPSELPDDGMSYDSMDVDIVWNDDRSCKVTQKIEFSVTDSKPTHGIFVDIPVNSGEKIRNAVVTCALPYSFDYESGYKLVRVIVGDEDRTLLRNRPYHFEITYDYITPKHTQPNVLALMAIGNGWKSPIAEANVTMTYPYAPAEKGGEYGIYVGKEKLTEDDERAVWSDDGKTVRISGISLKPFEGVELAYPMPDGVLKTRVNTEWIVTAVIGAILTALALVFELVIAKNKPLTPIVDYYPPRIKSMHGDMKHMLPVQMGKIIDDSCSGEDVTSLIFYWASEGYIEIEDNEDDTVFVKNGEVDPVTDYEKRLFDKLFEKGTERSDGKTEVTLSALKGKFANSITSTKNSVNKEYSGKLYKSTFNTLSIVMSVLCGLYALGISLLTTFRISVGFINIPAFLTVVPVVIAAAVGSIIAKRFFKLNKRKRNIALAAYAVVTVISSFAVSMLIPVDVMGRLERILFVVLLSVPSVISPFLIVRTEEYNEMLNSILGFRDFLRDAEKDRLETLLADDPQYYYNILPYANVLGVSDIWEEKFKDLTIEPPTYYHSNVSLFDIYVLHRVMGDVGHNLTYVPPKASGGSFSSFGGGGGGFSGGSFGGGGGGRW